MATAAAATPHASIVCMWEIQHSSERVRYNAKKRKKWTKNMQHTKMYSIDTVFQMHLIESAANIHI